MRVTPIFAALLALAASSCSRDSVPRQVTVEVYAMSKCAFSAEALTALIPALKQLDGRAALELNYVAKGDATAPSSPYGEDDLMGDRYQLCARELGKTDAWLGFLSCQNQDWEHVPANAEECGKKNGFDAEALRACAEGKVGNELLRTSLARSNHRNVSGTPTLFINGKLHTRGRTFPILARALCAALPAPRPRGCDALPEPVAIPVTIVGDTECTSDACGYRNFVRFLDFSLEGAEVLEVDARSATGSKLLASMGDPPTPLALFSTDIEKESATFARLRAAGMSKLSSGAGYAMLIRGQAPQQAQP